MTVSVMVEVCVSGQGISVVSVTVVVFWSRLYSMFCESGLDCVVNVAALDTFGGLGRPVAADSTAAKPNVLFKIIRR